MGDGIEQGCLLLTDECLGGQPWTIQGAVGFENVLTKCLDQLGECRLAGFDDIAGHLVRVDDEEAF